MAGSTAVVLREPKDAVGSVCGVLAEMRIQELGVIEDALLELDPGFTVVTGETGAGKTMVVSGLHLLSGGRSDVSKVRSGSGRASVEGRFDPRDAPDAERVIDDTGAARDEDGSVIAVRSVGADGRSRAHLGGRGVPVGALSDLAEQLLAVHGQNDQLRLLRSGEQRAVLDRFGGERIAGTLAEYRAAREEWLALTAELTERTTRSRELAQQADLLRHGISEIEAVAPAPGEDTELAEEIKRRTAVDELREVAGAAQQAVSGGTDSDAATVDSSGILGLLAQARRGLAGAADSRLRELETRLDEAEVLIGDVGAELGTYLGDLDADPERLEQAFARQAELKTLTRKYAADVAGVLDWAADARERLSGMDTSESALAELAARRDRLAATVASHAGRLHQLRTSVAGELAEAVTAELAELAMGDAAVEVTVRLTGAGQSDEQAVELDGQRAHAGQEGADEVELGLRTHTDGPVLPVHKAASGGELSRVMLAVEVVLADVDTVRTLVFDEVDAGVGGRAAGEIGRRLARLARSHQVLVVTHLPQVAAYADRHLVVDKASGGESVTRSGVAVLAQRDRVGELARMLAGMGDSETGLAHARELLDAAVADKTGTTSGQARAGRAQSGKKPKSRSSNK